MFIAMLAVLVNDQLKLAAQTCPHMQVQHALRWSPGNVMQGEMSTVRQGGQVCEQHCIYFS